MLKGMHDYIRHSKDIIGGRKAEESNCQKSCQKQLAETAGEGTPHRCAGKGCDAGENEDVLIKP